ncbi:capping protein inhibiting regulator of actin dynamics isoform X2 [Sardina pilchardus]|uniref:capping protein inhibiting regulator of actin dynamics isoform X2 n=1 Tax=Sardina pilchardus TaxID=27697 RepID=UPI002E120428
MSQENVSDKVRNLQRQIAQSIKFGQKPPSLRKSEDDEGSSDEEEVPRSPLKVMAQVETEPADDVEPQAAAAAAAAAAHATPVKSPRSKRILPPEGTIESINLDAVPQSGPRLDNAAAKHKLSVKPKNQRVSKKHRRFTQELQEVDLPGILQEESDGERAAEELSGPPEHSKKQKLQDDERDQLELRRKREQEEERLREEERKRAEDLRLAQERRLRLEEEQRKREEEEERRKIEEERRKREEEERVRRELEEKRRQEDEERRFREEQERKMREEEERKRREEVRKREEEERRRLEAERLRLEEERRIILAEEAARKEREVAEKRRLRELEEKRRREEEEQERLREEERRRQEEMAAERKQQAEEAERRRKEEEEKEKKRQLEEREKALGGGEIEWKRKAEEMRWKEMEERQPFTFKVSSGEKQILFQKVNLTPVTPGTAQQASGSSETGEGVKTPSSAGADSPTRSSIYVPHTAILVTGAQLCGTAVNLDQIKDTACKSLLGLGEDKKAMGTPTKTKTSPDRKSGKTKSLNLSSAPSDQASAAVMAEWASIRSKIFKGVEEGKYEEYPEPKQSRKEDQGRSPSEDTDESPQFPHPNLRKTLSASAKFSITPARKKFGDSNRNSEILYPDEQDDRTVSPEPSQPGPSPTFSSSKSQTKGTKSVRISDSSEECMFAKDLPSFLVPSSSQGSPIPQSPDVELPNFTDSETSSLDPRDEGEEKDLGGDERPSPFGIKLRRTNFSLRFHNEQSSEKRKKRYSAGDCFDGVPGPLTPMDLEAVSPVFSDRASPTSPLRENVVFKPATSPNVGSQMKSSRSPVPSVGSESDRFSPKPPVYQKPTTVLKPSDGATPPHSPLPKLGRMSPAGDAGELRKGSPHLFSDDERGSVKDDEASTSSLSPRISPGEEETKEKKSFFPSISIPWREKSDRKAELIRKEKPSLQSRHSLDSSKVQDKDKEAGPLWITLALQKQKGFREQQQTREERKILREAKLAEKQARERDSTVLSPTEGKGSGNPTPPKPQTPDEGKRPDSLLGRFERRENLKKANTLPSSVTVEITDSTPSPPAVKEVSKRFPPGDSQQVSTEPAWLALAKRKAKAWSDCPQIIK